MGITIQISQFLLSLSLLIILHELGHFIPAKLFKTRVEKFYLFFDIKFSLFKKKIGETVYGIGWLPLGGYVKISGMIDESMDTDAMAEEPKPWEFRSKPAWQRLIIMLGGVFVNFLLAYVIYVFLSFVYGDRFIDASTINDGYLIENPLLTDLGFKTGDNIIKVGDYDVENVSDIKGNFIGAKTVTFKRNGAEQTITLPEDFLGQLSSSKNRDLFEMRYPFIVAEVPDSSLNKSVNLKQGDVLTKIGNDTVKYFDQTESILKSYKGQQVEVEILREDKKLTESIKVSDEGKMEVVPFARIGSISMEKLGYYKMKTKEYTFGESFGAGYNKFTGQIGKYFGQLKEIGNVKTGAYKGVGGFYAILNVFPDFWSWQNFWSITAFLSIMLGVLNLLPIPALDGGHVMFLLYEMISGRKPSDKFMEYAQTVGFFILIGLVLFANGNDIFKAIFN
ncbi:RIP metalloprotease RseP [Lacinutrix sp. 5H-3-7-4]|uniref:RIP metalloprotease RseP n=1 Tax=Lacinutrix sp. (strain 5H-3-7-4) TaxID=983544 RepID=UPI00020A3B1C|nr:RIP metalloprotease RseP [Lacinutrix sp. 5H-3-7-4]AEH00999.1 peptidase M50 [Lacinutrix sp. 5H-3-7-4]